MHEPKWYSQGDTIIQKLHDKLNHDVLVSHGKHKLYNQLQELFVACKLCSWRYVDVDHSLHLMCMCMVFRMIARAHVHRIEKS